MPQMPPILEDQISPVRVYCVSFALSAFAGFVAYLREGKPWQTLAGVTHTLASGCLGTAMTMIWYWRFQDNISFLLGLVLLSCLGGRPVVDAVTTEIPAVIKRLISRWFGVNPREDRHVPDSLLPPHETRDPK